MQELLPPYLDALIGKLLGLLQNGAKLVQEGALTALASVADCAKEAFVKYYDQVPPPTCPPRCCMMCSHHNMQGLLSTSLAGAGC